MSENDRRGGYREFSSLKFQTVVGYRSLIVCTCVCVCVSIRQMSSVPLTAPHQRYQPHPPPRAALILSVCLFAESLPSVSSGYCRNSDVQSLSLFRLHVCGARIGAICVCVCVCVCMGIVLVRRTCTEKLVRNSFVLAFGVLGRREIRVHHTRDHHRTPLIVRQTDEIWRNSTQFVPKN